MRHYIILTGLLILSGGYACKSFIHAYPEKPNNSRFVAFNWAQAADSAQVALNKQFWSVSEKYYLQNNTGHKGFNYWWNAHALDVLVDGYNRTKNKTYITAMDELLEGMFKKNGNKWVNNFYDDMEWLVLALIRAHEATGTASYKTLAEDLWGEIKKGWTPVAGGGFMWQKGSPGSKNACANGPALIIAARLYRLNKNTDDLAWAKKIYQWQLQYLVNPVNGTVWDGTSVKEGVITPNTNVGMVLTYNQGTWLGGALELFRITGEKEYLNTALRTASYVVNDYTKFSPAGILKGENTGDGGLFKGIFIRYLAQLVQYGKLDTYTQDQFIQYLTRNGRSLLANGVKQPEFTFDPDWRNIPATAASDCSVQLSGLMLFEILDELTRAGLIKP